MKYSRVSLEDESLELKVTSPINTATFPLYVENRSSIISKAQESAILPRISYLEIISICYCVFVSDTCRGILFPTLWLRIRTFGGSPIYQGISIAMFSIGRIISSPIVGHLGEIYPIKWVLIGCNFIILGGSITYSLTNSLFGIILAQFIMGVGAGSLGVSRAFIVSIGDQSKKTVNLAFLTILQYGGFTVMSLVGAYLSFLGSLPVFQGVGIDKFTLPSLFLSFLSITSGILLWFGFFRRFSIPVEDDVLPSSNRIPSSINWNLFYILCFINMITKGTIGVFETLGSEYAMQHYHWSSLKIGYLFSLAGMFGLLSLLSFYILTKHFSDISLTIAGIMIMMISCAILSNIWLNSVVSSNVYYVSIFLMYSLGYPIGHTAALGSFSHSVTKYPKSSLFGYFASIGSFARITFPLLAGFISVLLNDSSVFGILSFCLLFLFVLLLFWKNSLDIIASR